jgi:hypothetical protein
VKFRNTYCNPYLSIPFTGINWSIVLQNFMSWQGSWSISRTAKCRLNASVHLRCSCNTEPYKTKKMLLPAQSTATKTYSSCSQSNYHISQCCMTGRHEMLTPLRHLVLSVVCPGVYINISYTGIFCAEIYFTQFLIVYSF